MNTLVNPYSIVITFSISDALSDTFIQHTEMKTLKANLVANRDCLLLQAIDETELAKQLLIYRCSKSFSFSSTSKILNLTSDLFEFTVKTEGYFA